MGRADCGNAFSNTLWHTKYPKKLKKYLAKAGHYAVGQFKINNIEWTKAILLTAQELNSPVILGVSEGAGKYMAGYKTVVGMVKFLLSLETP